ncbi:ribulose-phosphate 3-epimerase [Acuticoccus sp. MNP-M23]|uniref:ribulose-phosphate 3-epimerase n=1 Tax=Acuticoccus sp. MNP-M23 TaxID=3072793 RepID=UPI0028152E0D|nr:ribulose-phosphate 3-epimerase [Acuticoccus sp. MNP-M23]WMS42844.1 ribulose-phosphate 3-epimerase [Acuticoccus sp. MNP-M23]
MRLWKEPAAGQTLIAPSILAADFLNLGAEVKAAEAVGADVLHLDVMDGHFVPNISYGPAVVKALRGATSLPLDVHLMIEPVDPYLGAFADAGADGITVHVEATRHLDRTLEAIAALGLSPGVAINPATPVSLLEPVLHRIALILVMTVNPGFGGQSYLPNANAKIAQARALVGDRPIRVEADGGITPKTAPDAAAAGADMLVAGSAFFGPADRAAAMAALRSGAAAR